LQSDRAAAVRARLDEKVATAAREKAARDARGRDDARAQADLFYALHGRTLGKRFPKTTYDDFVERYLGDERPVEDVERRAAQLIEVMQRRLDQCAPQAKESPLDEMLKARREQSERLKREDLPEEWAGTLEAMLEQELFDQLQRRMEESR